MTDITLDDLADRDRTIAKLREQLASSELQRAEIFDACQAHAKEGSVLREQLRRLTLYAEAHTNFPGVDDLCEHGVARNIADNAVKLERARIERELGAFVDSVGAPFGMFDAAAVLHIVRGEQ